MFVEIIFIQRFVLYFGSPVYAAAMVIALMLACSGAGSLCAHTVKSERACAAAVFPAIIALALAALLLSDQLLRGTIGAGFSAKLATAMLVIGPISFCMGFPFPLGIRLLAKSDCEHAIPWAWGVNCCVSVVSSVLAVIIAVECGFKWIMVAAAFSYAVSCAAVMCGILRGR
jgi:hypothetical protein